MKIKSIIILGLTLGIMSCSIFSNNQDENSIKGKVIATKYMIGVHSNLKFYYNDLLFAETETTKKGEFNIVLPKKYSNKECMLTIEPLAETIYKDTLIEDKDIVAIQLSGFEIDTIYFNSFNDFSTIQFKKYYIMEHSVENSH